MAKENCKNCKHCYVNEIEDMVCVNPDSEYVADFVDEKHWCEDWESKKNETNNTRWS